MIRPTVLADIRPGCIIAIAVLAAVLVSEVASGQSDSQTFRVTTAETAGVISPPTSVLFSPGGNASSVFPPQRWTLATTSINGLVASFSMNEPFQHETEADAKINASLDVQVVATSGSGSWVTPVANASTDYQSDIDDAAVTVECDGHGQAEVDIVVGFDNSGDPPSGRYTATLYVTVTSP